MKKTIITHDQIFNLIAKELKENRNEGLWLECEIKSKGNQFETKKIYTQIRYEQLAEMYAVEILDPKNADTEYARRNREKFLNELAEDKRKGDELEDTMNLKKKK
jgi:hypothetical protein